MKLVLNESVGAYLGGGGLCLCKKVMEELWPGVAGNTEITVKRVSAETAGACQVEIVDGVLSLDNVSITCGQRTLGVVAGLSLPIYIVVESVT